MKLQNYSKPQTIEEAYQLLMVNENNAILGGGAWLKLTNKQIDTLIDVSGLGLDDITETTDTIRIGATTTLHQLQDHKIIQNYFDGILANAAKSIMGMNIRNIATIGGSIMGKYSFSDVITPLLALDANLIFHHHPAMKLADFLEDKHMEKDLLLAIELPKLAGKGYFYNIKKTAMDFAVLNIAVVKSDIIRIAVGARPGGSVLAQEAMAYLNANELSMHAVEQASTIAQTEIHVSENVRAGKEYRELLVHVYVQRGLKEVIGL